MKTWIAVLAVAVSIIVLLAPPAPIYVMLVSQATGTRFPKRNIRGAGLAAGGMGKVPCAQSSMVSTST
jgi:hypothetical protein